MLFETIGKYEIIQKYAENNQELPLYIKIANSKLSDYLKTDLACFDYMHIISKRPNENCVHTNRLELFPYYSKDVFRLTPEYISEIERIISECFVNFLFDWNKIKNKHGYYCYSIMEKDYKCIPKISIQNLKVSFSPYEIIFWDNLIENNMENIKKEIKRQLNISVQYIQNVDEFIMIFLKDNDLEILYESQKETLCNLCKEILQLNMNKICYTIDDKKFVIESSAKMINYR